MAFGGLLVDTARPGEMMDVRFSLAFLAWSTTHGFGFQLRATNAGALQRPRVALYFILCFVPGPCLYQPGDRSDPERPRPGQHANGLCLRGLHRGLWPVRGRHG